MDDWYTVTREQVAQNGGSGLLKRHTSLGHALKAVYPHHPWQLSRFVKQLPSGFWQDENNTMEKLELAEKALGIRNVCCQ